MKIGSPIDRGDLVLTGSLSQVPVLRELIYGTAWRRYFRSIKRQVEQRGPIPDAVWETDERRRAAKTIEKVLSEICWGEYFTFHPDDPFYVIAEFEIGDLSEVEAMMEIETQLGIKIDDETIDRFLKNKATFGAFVDYVVSEQRKGNPGTG
jgi:predicted nucleotidyltransferase